ncbi:MAG: Trm112 family protein [Aigarchaeota archaeon]|nr:Trm112 family protein [Aigarchaeota archaeon]MCX8192712.1 Trm112 family protein [Nitrososphaeria archaeon]MDW7985964.1 Trm112 family protein [Nitrososphaerota archaeon]
MKYRLMDLLACPICKKFPLNLIVFMEEEIKPPHKIVRCELFCAYHNIDLSNQVSTDCEKCYSREIRDGLIFCGNCNRWYPIEEEIPRMLPDELRNKNDDISFLNKWRMKIPERILYEGKPSSLTTRNNI